MEHIRKSHFKYLIFNGILTGISVAFCMYLYEHVAHFFIDIAPKIYDAVREDMRLLPLLIAGVLLIALIIGYTIKIIPEVRGGGIAYIEGVARSRLKIRFILALPAMFICSIMSIFLGMSVGQEGPAVFIGGTVGYGFGHIGKHKRMEQAVLVTAGSCTGLAMVFNAPITGMIFAFEEVHKRFHSVILLCPCISVLTGILIYNLIGGGLFFNNYEIIGVFDYKHILVAIVVGLISTAIGLLFSKTLNAKKLNLNKLPIQFRPLLPAIIAIVVGFSFPVAYGTGKHIIIDIAGYSAITLGVLLVVKFLSTVIANKSGASGGLFVPMLVLGGILGALVGKGFEVIGITVDVKLTCIMGAVTLFAAAVRAPLTAVVLSYEICVVTGAAAPIIFISVAISYIISELLRIQPMYETMMEGIIQSNIDNEKLYLDPLHLHDTELNGEL